MNLVCGLIITLMACQMGAAGNKISALKKRLNILEARVSLGENEFREGIEKLQLGQNQTCGCSDEEADTVDQSMTLVPQSNAEYKNMLQAFERFKHGVYSEKKFLRKTISDLLNKVDEHINSCQKINSDTLRIANSKLDALEQRVIDKQSGFNDKLVNLESQNEALEQRLIDKQSNFENKIVNLEKELGALVCQPDEKYHAGSCYKYVAECVSWTEAVENCTGMNSYLLEINDIPELDFIRSLMMMKENYYYGMWVGASYQETESAYVWNNSGQPVGDFLPRPYGALHVADLGNRCVYMVSGRELGYTECDAAYRCVYMVSGRELGYTECDAAYSLLPEYLCERTP